MDRNCRWSVGVADGRARRVAGMAWHGRLPSISRACLDCRQRDLKSRNAERRLRDWQPRTDETAKLTLKIKNDETTEELQN